MHIATIRETGGEILGIRPLSVDGLEPGEFLNMHGGNSNWLVLRGMQAIRPATPEDRGRIPVYKDLAGLEWIVGLAEKTFGPFAPDT